MPSNDLWWVVPLATFAAATIAAIVAIQGLLWRYRADYRGHIVNRLTESVQKCADLATEYWLIDNSPRFPVPPKRGERQSKSQRLEAQIQGQSEQIDAFLEIARPHLSAIAMLNMDLPWTDFLDGTTGGRFGDPTRPADRSRAVQVQSAAAVLIRELNVAADRRVLPVRVWTERIFQ